MVTMRRLGALCIGAVASVFARPGLCDEYLDKYHGDPTVIPVVRDDKIVDRLGCERIVLDYPELKGRAEANMALDRDGGIWAIVGHWKGIVRLFHSVDGGKTWTSKLVEPTRERHPAAFTVLQDNGMMLVTVNHKIDTLAEVLRSHDRGTSWKLSTKLGPSGGYEKIVEGALSLTQLRDGRVILPVARWTDAREGESHDKRKMMHSIFVSKDGGKTFPVIHTTFRDCGEAHIIELQSGKLLGAFRHQRWPYENESIESIKKIGGIEPGSKCHGVKIGGGFVLKNVFLGDSDDGGVTWKSFRPVRDKQGRALVGFGECHGQLVQLPDGRVILVHDRRYPREHCETRARVSRDGGQTWEPEVYYLNSEIGYPSSVALKDGTIVTITGNTRFTPPPSKPIGPWRAQVIRWKLP